MTCNVRCLLKIGESNGSYIQFHEPIFQMGWNQSSSIFFCGMETSFRNQTPQFLNVAYFYESSQCIGSELKKM